MFHWVNISSGINWLATNPYQKWTSDIFPKFVYINVLKRIKNYFFLEGINYEGSEDFSFWGVPDFVRKNDRYVLELEELIFKEYQPLQTEIVGECIEIIFAYDIKGKDMKTMEKLGYILTNTQFY